MGELLDFPGSRTKPEGVDTQRLQNFISVAGKTVAEMTEMLLRFQEQLESSHRSLDEVLGGFDENSSLHERQQRVADVLARSRLRVDRLAQARQLTPRA